MKNLTLGDLLLALPDLLQRRAGALEGLLCGRLLLPQVQEVWQEISALPLVSQTSKQFVDELSEADARHDGYASALALFAEAYERLPDPPPADTQALSTARAIIPDSAEVGGTYATQASRAQEREKAATAEQRQALAHFPVSGNRTLVDLFDRYLQAGSDIDTLLRQRADAASADDKDRSRAGVLRGKALGVLGQLRSALSGELRADPQRAQTLDKQLFAYIDLLQASRAKGGPGAPPPPPPATGA